MTGPATFSIGLVPKNVRLTVVAVHADGRELSQSIPLPLQLPAIDGKPIPGGDAVGLALTLGGRRYAFHLSDLGAVAEGSEITVRFAAEPAIARPASGIGRLVRRLAKRHA